MVIKKLIIDKQKKFFGNITVPKNAPMGTRSKVSPNPLSK